MEEYEYDDEVERGVRGVRGSRSGREVAVTGLGIVSTLGVGMGEFWPRFVAGERAPLGTPESPAGAPPPGPAHAFRPEFEAERYADPRTVRKISALSRIAIVAARTALADAAWPDDFEIREKTRVSLGTSLGSSGDHFEYHEGIRKSGAKSASALLFTESVFNAASGHVAKVFGLRGANHAFVGGEDVGLAAVALAATQLRTGSAPAALAGGVEEYSPWSHRALHALGLVGSGEDPALPLPFAEGSALLVLEGLELARARGASPRAIVLGEGSSRIRPAKGCAIEAAARSALERAGCAGIDLVVAGAAGGELAGRFDTALARLEGVLGGRPPVVRPKCALGCGFAYASAALALVGVGILSSNRTPGALASPPRAVLVVDATRPGGATALVLGHAGS